MSNLIDLIKEQVTPEVVGQLAKMTGQNETQIAGAVDAVVPTLVGGALSKSATPAGAVALLDAIGSLGPLDNFASLLGGGDAMHNLLTQGGDIVSSLFGANANQIANGINSAAAIHGSSASILMYAMAPLTLSAVGQTLGSDNLNPTALTNLLADQGQSVQAALPAGLGNLVGFSAPEPAPAPIAAKVEPVPAVAKVAPPAAPKPAVTGTVPPPPPPPSRSIWRWLGPLLILLLVGVLLWWFLLRPQTGTVPPAAATPAPAAATNTPAAAGAPLTPTVAAESTTMVTATTTATDTAGVTATVSPTPTTAAADTTAVTTTTTATTTATTATDTTGVTTTDSVTPTTAAADTTAVTATTTATDTAGVTTTDSVTPTAAAEANNAALCTALAQLDLVLGAAPAITTTTPVTDVRRLVGNAGIVITAVSTAAEGISGVDLGATAAAVQDLTTAADGLTGDTVGAAAVPVAASLNSVRDSYAELNTAAGCP